MVSIAIIGILASLLLSEISNVRRSAERVEGISVMRNIGQAMSLYAGENQNRLPGPLYWRQPVLNGSGTGYIIPKLAPYMKTGAATTSQLFQPAYAKAWAKKLAADPTITIYEVNTDTIPGTGQWAWGDANIDKTGHLPGSVPLSLMAIVHPGQTVALSDSLLKDLAGSTETDNQTIWGYYKVVLYFDDHVEGQKEP